MTHKFPEKIEMKQSTKTYKSYEHMLQELGEEEMTKIMMEDMKHVFNNFPEIWRVFSTPTEKQIMTDKRLEYLELVLGSSIGYPATLPLSFEELQANITKQIQEQKNES